MKFDLQSRDHRALIGLVLAVAAYAVLSLGVFPAYDSLKTASETAAEKEEQLRKYRRALIRKGHYEKLLEEARKNVAAGDERLIRGDNQSLASVELQTIIEEAVKKVNIALAQRNISVAKKKDDFFNEITMTMTFECTPNQLATFLSEIRSSLKFIAVRSIQISPAQVAHEAPKGDFRKLVKVHMTAGALLAAPVVPPALPGGGA